MINKEINKKLISLNINELIKEEIFIKKLKTKKKITGIFCLGDSKEKPITFKNFEDKILINWCFSNLKIEFFIKSEFIKEFIHLYHRIVYYNEWGDISEKPIIYTELITKKNKIKIKNSFKSTDLWELIKKEKEIYLLINYETTIGHNPEKICSKHDIWLSYIGGMYEITDVLYFIEEKEEILEYKEYKKNFFEIFNKKKKILKDDLINLNKIIEETSLTARDLKIKGNWEIFKYEYLLNEK